MEENRWSSFEVGKVKLREISSKKGSLTLFPLFSLPPRRKTRSIFTRGENWSFSFLFLFNDDRTFARNRKGSNPRGGSRNESREMRKRNGSTEKDSILLRIYREKYHCSSSNERRQLPLLSLLLLLLLFQPRISKEFEMLVRRSLGFARCNEDRVARFIVYPPTGYG